MIGKQISHYQIVSKIGQGGMGEVFLADDTSLGRKVALKFLPADMQHDDVAHRRFLREARSAAALNHPYVCNIHEVGESEGKDFIVMEYVEGETLRERLARERFPLRTALEIAREITEALEHAHDQGIIHRDLKPANIMVARGGHVKVMDFGLAKQVKDAERAVSQEDTLTVLTRQGSTLGTLAYMSPEQLRGEAVDARSDIFSFGIVFYEILTGSHPFRESSPMDTASGILTKEPAPLTRHLAECPDLLRHIASRMLAKDRASRYPSTHHLRSDLNRLIAELDRAESGVPSTKGIWRMAARPAVLVPAVAAVAVLIYLASTAVYQNRKAKWAREVALPEIQRLASADSYSAAFRLALDAEKYIPTDPQLLGVFSDVSRLLTVRTSPPGATVHIKDYGETSGGWEALGTTPLEDVRVSRGFKQYRIAKSGFDELTGFVGTDQRGRGTSGLRRTLHKTGTVTADMVLVEGGDFDPVSEGSTTSAYRPTVVDGMPAVDLGQFLIDRTEVTNRQFQAFVDAGGYQDKKYWKHEFIRDGKRLEWDSAIAEFKDRTGRAGPATWELSRYPRGQDDHPVGGISWYEAAAYAEFANKALPTIYHWNKAVGLEMNNTHPLILKSNFQDSGAVAVGTFQGVSPYGARDMVGNLREWCWNPAEDRRVVVGGSWGAPQYMATWVERLPAFDRSERNGFRCIRPLAGVGIPESTKVAVLEASPVVDLSRVRPVPDEVFNAYQNAYAYDKGDLEPVIEATEDLWGHCTRQRVSFNAAYGGERVIAYLYLPTRGKAPFQTVIYFPGSGARSLNSIDGYGSGSVELFTRAGRAVVFPVYKGTFQRPRVDTSTPTLQRDRDIILFKDLGRTIDYLETRSEFDTGKLAYYGLSWGAKLGPIHGALEKRLKVLILVGASLPSRREDLPEIDWLNFAARSTASLLALQGRYDLYFPESTAESYLGLFGTPREDKQTVFYDSGHVPPLNNSVVKEMINWLDKYLGPVRQ